MPLRRRLVRLLPLLAAGAWLLLVAGDALGAAGGGSSGFGGGGGGGGGFGGGGSSYGGGSGSGSGGSAFVLVVIAVVVIAVVLASGLQTRKLRKRREARRRQVELASAEAADDDPRLAHDVVVEEAERIFRMAQEAWDARDVGRLEQLLSPDLLVEWRRRLDDFARRGWRNRVEVLGVDAVEYLGLVNREGEHEDRVTCRITARLRDYVATEGGARIMRDGASSETVALTEHWTFGRRDGGWVVVSIESDAEGAHVLEQEIVATPWDDEQRMRDASLVEVAAADKLPEGVATAEVADLDFAGDARAAALDLSLADGRWAPDVLAAAARRAVAAWAEAVDGADRDLLDVAAPAAADALLHLGDMSRRTRLVVRGPRVRGLRIAALDPAATPPTMTVEVEVSGRRYVEDRDTAEVLSGSKERETTSAERWTFALAGPDDRPWQVVAVA